MGTNYYAEFNRCNVCKRPEQRIHIGKQSVGWRFAVEVHKEFYEDWAEFKAFIQREDICVRAGYREDISAEELIKLIEARNDNDSHRDVHSGPVDLVYREFS